MIASLLNSFMKELVEKTHHHHQDNHALKVVITEDNARTHDLKCPLTSLVSCHSGTSYGFMDESVRNSPPRQPQRTLELADTRLPPAPAESSCRSSLDMSDFKFPALRRSISQETAQHRRSSLDLSRSKLRTTRWQAGNMFSSDSKITMLAPLRAPPSEHSPKMPPSSKKQRKTLCPAMDSTKIANSLITHKTKMPDSPHHHRQHRIVTAENLNDMFLDDNFLSLVSPEDHSSALDEVLDVVGDLQQMSVRA